MAETKPAIRKADMLPAPIITLMQSLVPDCATLLPADITPEQFRAALWLELTGRPDLHDCTGQSLRECVWVVARQGLPAAHVTPGIFVIICHGLWLLCVSLLDNRGTLWDMLGDPGQQGRIDFLALSATRSPCGICQLVPQPLRLIEAQPAGGMYQPAGECHPQDGL